MTPPYMYICMCALLLLWWLVYNLKSSHQMRWWDLYMGKYLATDGQNAPPMAYWDHEINENSCYCHTHTHECNDNKLLVAGL